MKDNKYQTYLIWITFIIGFLYLLLLLLNSKGTPLHDEIAHYLISRDALHTPQHIFDIWGRTVNTLIYIIPAQFGLGAARFFSLILALLTALFTLKVSKLLQVKYFFLVPLFLWFQPWFADVSYTCMTVVPFSLIMISGTYFYLKKHPLSASIVIGFLPLIRHEGIALVALWCIYMLYKKDFLSAVLVFSPLFVYNIVYYSLQGTWPFAMYFEPKPTDIYGRGTWYHFLIRLPHPRAVGIPIMLLVICSIVPIVKSIPKLKIFLWYFFYFVLHTVIFRFGLFASGGYKLFLLPLAPAFAIAAVLGLQWISAFTITYLQRFKTLNKAIINEKNLCAVVCSICVLFTLIFVKPYPLDREGIALKKAAEWIHQENLDNNNIVSTHVYFYHFMPLRVPPVTLWEKFPPLSDMPEGTIVIWDIHYSNRWGLDYEYLISHPEEWSRLKDFEEETVVVFRKNST